MLLLWAPAKEYLNLTKKNLFNPKHKISGSPVTGEINSLDTQKRNQIQRLFMIKNYFKLL